MLIKLYGFIQCVMGKLTELLINNLPDDFVGRHDV